MKRAGLIGALVFCLLFALSAQADTLRGYDKNQGGWQYVNMGAYPYEADGTQAPVLWQVLRVQDGKALLLTTYVVDTQQVIFVSDQSAIKNHSYRRISDYAESDLIGWMNNVMFPAVMGQDALSVAVTEEKYGKLYILTRGLPGPKARLFQAGIRRSEDPPGFRHAIRRKGTRTVCE